MEPPTAHAPTKAAGPAIPAAQANRVRRENVQIVTPRPYAPAAQRHSTRGGVLALSTIAPRTSTRHRPAMRGR